MLPTGTSAESLSDRVTVELSVGSLLTVMHVQVIRPSLSISLVKPAFRSFDGCTATFERTAVVA